VEACGAEYINIFDDIFHLDVDRLRRIVEQIERLKLGVEFGVCGNHAPTFTEEIAKLYKRMNVSYCGFGLESHSPRILRYLKNGVATPEDNQNAVDICRKYDIPCGSGFLVSVPGETKDDLRLSQDFVLKNRLDSFGFYYTVPLPGTPFWTYALSKGLVSEDMDWSRLNQFESGNNVTLNEGEKNVESKTCNPSS
jgi:radical SAM superfamily enzyme YgiQ (UPF0313 family)